MLATTIAGLSDLIFPPECPGCGWRTGTRFLCEACLETLRDAADPIVTAKRHLRTKRPVALWLFEANQPVQKVMHQLKYGNRPWLGIEIGRMLGEKLIDQGSVRPDLVIPVPLHEARRFDRGYNQSEWLARGVGRTVGAKAVAGALERTRPTRSQTGLAREERTANVDGAFLANGELVDGAEVMLVDDILTTGATLFACACALVDAGARSVLPCAAAAAPLRAVMELDLSIPVIPA